MEAIKFHHKLKAFLLVLAGITLFWSAYAAANEESVKYRQAVYGGIGKNMSAMASIVRGKVANVEDLPALASSLAELASLAPGLFPEDSQGGDALPVIWEEVDDFKGLLAELRSNADNLAEVALTGNRQKFAKAFGQLGRSCKNCHDRFKAE